MVAGVTGWLLGTVSTRGQDPILAFDVCTSDLPVVSSNLTAATQYLNAFGFYTKADCAVYSDAWNIGNYFYFRFNVAPGFVLDLDRYELESLTDSGGPSVYNVMVSSSLHAQTSISGGPRLIPGRGSGVYTNVVADHGGVPVTGLAGTVEVRVYGEGAANITNQWWHRAMRLYGSVGPSPLPPDCSTPVTPEQGAVFVNPSAPMQWTVSPLASGYSFFLGTDNPPTDLENGLSLGAVTEYTPTNLIFGQTYYWKVVPTNGMGSATGCPVWSFSTSPDPDTLSCVYTQTFDAFPLGISSGEVAEGWTNVSGDDGDWTVKSGTTPSGETGPSADHTTSTGRYLFTEASSSGSPGSPDKSAVLISPMLDASGLMSPILSFWYHMYGADMGELHADIFSGGAWHVDVMPPLAGDQGDLWRRSVVDLSTYSSPIQIRFRGITGSGFASDMAIDDVQICGLLDGVSPSPARIDGLIVAFPQITLAIGDLTAGAVITIERSSTLAPLDWVNAGGFVSGGTSTNWTETVPGGWDRAYYRVLSR